MPVINLIQEQRLALHKTEQQGRIAYLTLIGTGAVAVFGYGILFFQGQALKSEVTRLQTDLNKTSPIVAQIEDNERQGSLLSPKLTTLQSAQKQSDCWARILEHFQTQTPTDTWLTGLQASSLQADKPTTLLIQGTGKAQQPIGEFILRVENEPDLGNVALHFTQEKRNLKGGRAIDFEVGAEIAGSEDQKKTVKEVQKS